MSSHQSQSISWPGLRRRRAVRYGRAVAWAASGVLLGSVLIVVFDAQTAAASTGGMLAVKTLGQVIDSARTWVVGILVGVATFLLTLGGLRYMLAGGNPGEVEKAKTAMKSAGFGYALAVLAPVLVQILRHILGA